MPELVNLVRPLRNLALTNISRPRTTLAVSIDWEIESSPTIVIGTDSDSLPSFLSGTLSLNVNEPPVEIGGFTAVLNVHTVQKKPVKNRCAKCKDQYFEIHHWSFLNQHTVLQSGSQTFPFSTLIPGHLPASIDSPLLSISYEFHAEVHFKSQNTETNTPRTVDFKRILTVRRRISVPNLPLQTTRNFPAEGIRVESSINPIIRPAEVNNVSLSLTGLLVSPGNGQNDHLWRLWKGAWRLEENIEAIAIPCERHRCLVTENGSEGFVRRKSRTLGKGGIYNAWEENAAEGTAEVEFGVNIRQSSNGPGSAYSYDTKSLDGTKVTHALVIELVFVKEHFPQGQLDLAIRTGVGRILTLTYLVVLADDQSIAPGWAMESLPSYQDEWVSPPGYLEGVFNQVREF
ncbi:Endocytosis regulator [Fusarium falciforme]|uniref:Endocytosis regulator n=1 Tax=Fusarium falciforme TaxID=195108 RepID=A0A9W8UVS6_9HYPO|nr:Endocytosis regulator [Fusarium falciforme]KAJ4178023.1 Endocytosis regulator [Fusarium falciforme]